MTLDDFTACMWSVENCHNPKKGWIRDSKGRRITVLTSRGACERTAKEHNLLITSIRNRVLCP